MATITVRKRENAPDFVVGSFGFKYDEFRQFVNSKGYINFDILNSKHGDIYIKVNDYGIKKDEAGVSDVSEEEIPF